MKRILSALIALSICASPFIGCSKKDDGATATQAGASGAAALVNDPLLSKLPTTTQLFYLLNASGDAYKRLIESPWAKSNSGLGSLQDAITQMSASGADPAQIAGLQVVFSTLQNLGLVSADGKSSLDQVCSKIAFFVGLADNKQEPLEGGVYFAGAPGASLKSKLPILRQILADADMIVAEQKIAGVDGIVARPAQQSEDAPQEIAIYLAATDSLMAISLTQSGAESLFSSANTDTIKRMSDTPEFKKATGALGITPNSIAFGYLDMKKLIPVVEKVAANNGTPEDDLKQIRELPVDGIAITQSYDTQIVSAIGIAVSSRSDTQAKLLTALEGASIPASLAKLPTDTAFAIGLDTRFVAKLNDFLAGISDSGDAVAVQQIKDLQGVTLGIRNGDGSSPLPDIYLVVNAANRDSLAATAEGLISKGLEGSGAPPQWSSKEIDGTPTKFLMTMFGAGMYLSSPKASDALVIGSSERAVRDVLQALGGQKGGIVDSLQASLKDSLSASKLASMYFNAIQTASLIDSMKSTLAMFTGPSPELDQALNTERLKRFGLMTISVSYSNGLFLVESVVDGVQGAK